MGRCDVGNTFITNEGYEVEIVGIGEKSNKRRIKFIDCGNEIEVFESAIRTKSIKHPNHKGKYDIGTIHRTNEGYDIEIIARCKNVRYRRIKFLDGYEYETEVQMGAMSNGSIKNQHSKSVCGMGMYSKGKWKANEKKKHTREYNLWTNMLKRAYDPILHEKRPTYIDVEVSEELLDFQNFCEIVTKIPFYDAKDKNEKHFAMDKDLFNIEEYSKDTIVFIPQSLNSFFINNQKNRGKSPKGVRWDKKSKRYLVNIGIDGKKKYLGSFNTVEDAHQCYCKARNEYAKTLAKRYQGKVEQRVIDVLNSYDEEVWI